MELLFPLLMLGAMWFLLIRPQQQRARAQRALLSALAVGDEVLTVGGIFGTITDIDGDSVTVSVSSTVELTFVRAAISQRVGPEAAGVVEDDGDAAPSGGDE